LHRNTLPYKEDNNILNIYNLIYQTKGQHPKAKDKQQENKTLKMKQEEKKKREKSQIATSCQQT